MHCRFYFIHIHIKKCQIGPVPIQIYIITSRLIVSFATDNVPYASSRIAYVAITARDQMDMAMKNCLPCAFATIHANIKSINIWIGNFNRILLRYQQIVNCENLTLS